MGNIVLSETETRLNKGQRVIFYDKFRNLCKDQSHEKFYKYITKRTLQEIMPFGISSTNQIFSAYDPNGRVLFKMVDWKNKNAMKLEELHELFKWTIKGLGRVCQNITPKAKSIQLVSYKAFNSADSDGSNTLDISEMRNWIELNQYFINYCKKFEKFPPFNIEEFTDDVLETQSDMQMINKGTFSSMSRLLQSSKEVKQKVIKSTQQIQSLKMFSQKDASNQPSHVHMLNQMKQFFINKIQSNPTSPQKSPIRQDKVNLQLKKQIVMPKLKAFENKFECIVKKSLALDDFEFRIQQQKADEYQRQFTPLNQYMEQVKEEKQKEKLRKINKMKEVLEFKERQAVMNLEAFQVFKQQVSQKHSVQQNPPKMSQSSQRVGKKGIETDRTQTQQRQRFGRKPTLFKNSSMNTLIPQNLIVDSSIRHMGLLTLEDFNEQKKRILANNYINLRGKVYSKKWIQWMKKCYDLMDETKRGYITVDDYTEFSQKFPALKKVSNSLFNHFDINGMGKVTFEDMLISMIPGATEHDLNKMISWVNMMYVKKPDKKSYQDVVSDLDNFHRNSFKEDSLKADDNDFEESLSSLDSIPSKRSKFNSSNHKSSRHTRRFSLGSFNKKPKEPYLDKNMSEGQAKHPAVQLGPNGLPLAFINQEMILEFRNIFELYDDKKKGYLSRAEFIKSLSGLYDLEKIIAILKACGFENERQITIGQFIQMVKPDHIVVPQAVIENLNEMYKDKFQTRVTLVKKLSPALRKSLMKYNSFGSLIVNMND
ncbi:UNKNOWN [Stylonychia lemnae]|uniref:EF-hand domain-containing protein n=1 Tax=Stylonychia lemnae TaxID=5949 RepID=A0A078BAZ5_STYLE|nr:UNKNOWN [Stylonychia lemnae]|eukprot:CDW90407.1 UNKNOWN [Stylonychia lemnae]